MLEIRDLTKTFGSLKAVDGISFHAQPGEIYGLLGPNGAGKTTTISCLCGLLRPDAGGIALDGVELAADPLRFKRMLGIVPQETALYGDLSARENLDFWGRLAGLDGRALRARIDEVLAAVGLGERAREPARKFSGGMRRRLNLAIGMLHEPRLLLLDEPTVGIDIQARLNILDVVRGVAQRGAIILYTTHYLEEAQGLCDRIGIMDHGRILAEGTLDELKRLVGVGGVLSLHGGFKAEALRAAVEGDARVRISALEDGRAMLDVGVERGEISDVLTGLLGRKLGIDDISIQEPNLQAVFLKLTGRELRD
jgi:ABC-2 type transport system ATP-binding protein